MRWFSDAGCDSLQRLQRRMEVLITLYILFRALDGPPQKLTSFSDSLGVSAGTFLLLRTLHSVALFGRSVDPRPTTLRRLEEALGDQLLDARARHPAF